MIVRAAARGLIAIKAEALRKEVDYHNYRYCVTAARAACSCDELTPPGGQTAAAASSVAWLCGSRTSRSTARMNAGRSPGPREVTTLPSTTTALSS